MYGSYLEFLKTWVLEGQYFLGHWYDNALLLVKSRSRSKHNDAGTPVHVRFQCLRRSTVSADANRHPLQSSHSRIS